MKKTILHLYLYILLPISLANNAILRHSPMGMTIVFPTIRNFLPIYSANNPIRVSLLAGQG